MTLRKATAILAAVAVSVFIGGIVHAQGSSSGQAASSAPAGSNGQAAGGTQAASADAKLPSFEVASIKPDTSGFRGMLFQFPSPDHFHTINMPVRVMITFAYNVKPFQVTGGPSWIDSTGYVIDAKVEDAMVAQMQKMPRAQQADQMRLMLRSLLADRFKLKLTEEKKDAPIYALVVAKGGPKLTPTTITEEQLKDPSSLPPQGRPHLLIMPTGISAVNQPMTGLADVLAFVPDLGGRVVQDQTGIKGNYDFELKFDLRPPGSKGPDAGAAAPVGGDAGANGDTAVSVFTALQEQLGLKLDSTKGPVEMYTVEHVEQPSEN